MNKVYLFAGIAFVVIVVGALYFRGKSEKIQKNPTPTPIVQEIMPSATPSTTLKNITTPMKTKHYDSAPTMTIDPNKTYIVTLTTDKGAMRLTLFAKDAPATV